MLIKVRVKPRPAPADAQELTQLLKERHGSIRGAAAHYGLARNTLHTTLQQPHINKTAAHALSRDYNLKHLAAECDCGNLYFPATGGHTHCASCNTEKR